MKTVKHCENNDGPANFEGFGHVFCWRCYRRFVVGQGERSSAEMAAAWRAWPARQSRAGEQLELPGLDAATNKIVE